jgi:hypothetical protein
MLFGCIVDRDTDFLAEKEKEDDMCDGTDREIDSEAPPPGNRRENTAKDLSSAMSRCDYGSNTVCHRKHERKEGILRRILP